jgi:hypothetical protein
VNRSAGPAIRLPEEQWWNGLDGEVGAHVLFARGSWTHLFAELDQDIDLVGRDAFNCLPVMLGEVIRVQNACFGESFDIGLFR